jgi:hypothetical protein
MLYSPVNSLYYEEYMHELRIYSRKSESEALKEFFKAHPVTSFHWTTDVTTLPELVPGYEYVPVSNDAGVCLTLTLNH